MATMQLGLIITLVLVGSLLHDRSCFAHDCGQSEKSRPKPREIRGFKPDHMSTAYGFGKREVSKQNRFDKLMVLMQHFPRSVAVHWLLREMNRNPEFARKVLRMVTADEDPAQTGELLKAEQTLSYV